VASGTFQHVEYIVPATSPLYARTANMIWEDEEWCAAVEEFIH